MVWGFFLYKLILFSFVFSFSLTNFLLFLSFFFIVGQNRQQQFFANIFLIGIHRIQPEIKKWKKLEFEKLSLFKLKLCIILFAIKRLNFTILAQFPLKLNKIAYLSSSLIIDKTTSHHFKITWTKVKLLIDTRNIYLLVKLIMTTGKLVIIGTFHVRIREIH